MFCKKNFKLAKIIIVTILTDLSKCTDIKGDTDANISSLNISSMGINVILV